MANRRSTRKNRSGFLGRLYGPVNEGLGAVGNVGKELTRTVGNVFGRTVNGVRSVGNKVTGRVNRGVGQLVSGKTRKNRKNRSNRNRSNRNRSNRNRRN
jgi:hypothetical protein